MYNRVSIKYFIGGYFQFCEPVIVEMCDIFITLPEGRKMPALGYGTWQATGNQLEVALDEALRVGYRHIDTAAFYNNEESIGRVLKKWIDSEKLKREDIFLTTKLPPTMMYPDKVEACLKESLRKLQLDYVDLYLIHFPITISTDETGQYYGLDVDYVDIWKKMEELYDAGLAKNIGISNFSIKKIDRLLKNCRVRPANNQIEVHVYFQQRELIGFCKENGITIVAYSPLGSKGYNVFTESFGLAPKDIKDMLSDETVVAIAGKHSKTPAQVLLRFLLQQDLATIPKSSNPTRIRENFDVFDFHLDEEDVEALCGLDIGPDAKVCNFDVFGEKVAEHPYFEF